MDKIFGYENFKNEVIWSYTTGGVSQNWFSRKHDVILFYTKSRQYKFSVLKEKSYFTMPRYKLNPDMESGRKLGVKEDKGGVYREVGLRDVWEIKALFRNSTERIGYPTQKPIELMTKIIESSSMPGDLIADFFCGGGSLLAAAIGQRVKNNSKGIPVSYYDGKLKRSFIGCDSSRVAVSVTLDRLVKIGEEMSGVKSNVSAKDKAFQLGLQAEGMVEKVPSIKLWYSGVYPVEKFKNLDQEQFIKFVLTAYGASRNTAAGIIHGYKPPAQQEPIYIGPADPNQPIDAQELKEFFDEVKTKVEPNKMIRAKIIAWRFSRQSTEYLKVLQRYCEKNNLLIELEAIPLDSKNFRRRVLERLPGVDEAELYLRFSKPPVIGDIKVKKLYEHEYQFEAIDVLSMNEDGWLVNCQWDFDYQTEHFTADKDYILSREKKKDKKRGEIFEAILTAKHKFEKSDKYIIACKVQDNFGGETILFNEVNIYG